MRKFIYLFTSFVALALVTINASHAVYDPNAKHSKWFNDSIVNDPTVKSTVEVKAQRTYPVSTIGADGKPIIQNKIQKSTIKVAANASSVGKSLIKRIPSAAITQALIVLLGKSVDWVMDSENNRVKYTDFSDPIPSNPANTPYYSDFQGIKYYAPTPFCQAVFNSYALNQDKFKGAVAVGEYKLNRFYCYLDGQFITYNPVSSNPAYDPSAPSGSQPQERYLPIDTVAQQVIDNADSGHAPSMEVMTNTALDSLEQNLLDSQLEAAASPKVFNAGETDPTDPNQPDPETPTDPSQPDPETPTDPETSADLPPFCAWATKVCGFIDWMQADYQDDGESGDIEVETPDPDMHVGILERLYIDMPAACPADPILEFMGAKIPFPMSIFCQFAEMMKPLILLFAYIKGLSIIGNGLT